MTLEQLQQFLVVARLNSFSKAAQALFVSHSTISRNISALEKSLGVPILNRDTRSVSLTEGGKVLYEKGSELMKQVAAMERDVRKTSRGVIGLLNIACVSIYEENLFRALREFQREHTEIDLVLTHHGPEEVVQEVLFDRADMGITYSFALGSGREQFDLTTVARGKFCMMASEDCDTEQLQKFGTPEFQGIKVLTLSGLYYDFIEQLTRRTNEYTREYQTETLESMLLQVKAGAGVCIVPEHVAKGYGSGYQIVELDQLAASDYDVVMFSRKSNRNPTLSVFTEWYQKLS